MTREHLASGRVTLFAGDCLDVLAGMAENSVDAVVTDPPYHLTSNAVCGGIRCRSIAASRSSPRKA